MGTLILLSSSPPRQFARSPTPAVSSSPAFRSPSSIFGNGHRKFQTSTIQRDGFEGGSGTVRSILGTKVGLENLPLGVTKSQNTWEKAAKELATKFESVAHPLGDGREPGRIPYDGFGAAEALAEDFGKKPSAVLPVTKVPVDKGIKRFVVTEAEVRPSSPSLGPLLLDKAPSRRLDWTPSKGPAGSVVDLEFEAGSPRIPFPGGLLENFGYEGASAPASVGSRNNEEGAPTKRRRIDFVDSGTCKPQKIAVPPKLVPASKHLPIATTKRSKSPKKKYTTITGLATSHYFGKDPRELDASPMLQYLSATQARDITNSDEPPVGTTKAKRVPKKARTKKKSLPASVLLSPESAMKAIDSQDMVFGSASQLAREDSPTLIRDVVRETKQPESSVSCTPVPTQITISSEPGSRGNSGTSRFIKSKNLWATASRDEDNALLQVDSIDLFDSPDLRLAFPGKDAMLEPTAPRHRESASPEKAFHTPRDRHLRQSEASECNGWLDIDDIGVPTPRAHVIMKSAAQTRTMHTASGPLGERAKSPLENDKLIGKTGKKESSTYEHEQVDTSASVAASSSDEPPRLQMPVFTGFTTAELSNQIKNYGFKPIKKREKMIEVLQNCWEAKHKPNQPSMTNKVALVDTPDEQIELAKHGDILSNVHGLAARSVPRVPKTKIPKPKTDEPATPANPSRRKAATKDDKNAEKTPKQRKKAEPKTQKPRDQPKEKVTHRRKAKASALSAEYVIDVSDIEDSAVEKSDKTLRPLALGTAGVRQGSATQLASLDDTPPAFDPNISSQLYCIHPRPPEEFTPVPDINSKITEAITNYVAPPSRDHQRNPTWHEKILMYDPIVLEDLAAWLNTEGLGLVGEDREVGALEVRAWCEMKGVCCYGVGGGWRSNVKGKAWPNGADSED
jgi:hypothetical protein